MNTSLQTLYRVRKR